MGTKQTSLSESLPDGRVDESGIDILFQNDEWITDYSPKGIRSGFFASKDIIITAKWDCTVDDYVAENIKITLNTAKQIKWKLIE